MRRAASASRPAGAILIEQGRGIFRTVIDITPPGHGSVKAGSTAATKRSEAKISGDIAKLYGSPSRAYNDIWERAGEQQANAFWSLKTKNPAAAAELVRTHTGASFSPFDGGELHRRQFKRGRVNAGRRKTPLIYVRDPKPLEDYIKSVQSRVNFLAAGWEEVARKLGVSLAQSISRHSAPSVAIVDFTMDHLRVIATNAVSYASNTDLERRIQWAIDTQAAKMQRQWEFFVANLSR